jgi:hypothetical protein
VTIQHRPARQHSPEGDNSGGHAYPRDLARLVRTRWSALEAEPNAETVPLPEPAVLEHVLSVCYQASLLREEGRSTTFRVAMSGPGTFAKASGPPAGLHRLLLTRHRPFDEHELRRLAPAAGFQSALIGAELSHDGSPQIWGLIHSGPRWLQSVRGGREVHQVIPPVLMIAVTGPGRVLVSRGMETIAEMSHGSLDTPGMDVLNSAWMSTVLAEVRDAQSAAVSPAQQQSVVGSAPVDVKFRPLLTRHVLRRVLATIRGAQHGGTLLLLPLPQSANVVMSDRYVSLKYGFRDEEPRRRILTLTVEIIKELASLHPASVGDELVHWPEYEQSHAPQLAALDEALFEVAHLVAALAQVDGAVVMTSGLELLGFGGEIAGDLPEVERVARALNLEATQREWVRADRVGTRHRSAYRLCQAVRSAIAVVISQDGGLRFVRWQDDAVTYWDQVATGPWEV